MTTKTDTIVYDFNVETGYAGNIRITGGENNDGSFVVDVEIDANGRHLRGIVSDTALARLVGPAKWCASEGACGFSIEAKPGAF